MSIEDDERAELIHVLDVALWERGNNVRNWPADEAEAYRELGWAEGNAAARAIVLGKAADAVLCWQESRGAKYGECAECGQPYERHNSPGGVFYSHLVHPTDEHDATPVAVSDVAAEINRLIDTANNIRRSLLRADIDRMQARLKP